MKKLIFIAMTLLLSLSANASVRVMLNGEVVNSDRVYLQSLDTGERLYGTAAGQYSVISDAQLAKYAEGSPFSIALDRGVTVTYCAASAGAKKQFVFKSSKIVNNTIKLTLAKTSSGSSAVCEKL